MTTTIRVIDEVTTIKVGPKLPSWFYSYNAETLAANKTLTDQDAKHQALTPSGANRDVNLPTAATTNHPYFIVNPAGSSYSLVVKSGATTLATLAAGESALVVSDGAAWHVVSGSGGAAETGWVAGSGTWSYTSADAPTFVMSVPDADAESIGLGYRVRVTQTTDKYFIVTAIGSPGGGYTPLTVYGGTDYTLVDAAIVDPAYSPAKAPLGFPARPDKWTVTVTDTSNRDQASPAQNTWYNLGSVSINIPIGAWLVSYKTAARFVDGSATTIDIYTTLSTANNSASDSAFTVSYFQQCASANLVYLAKHEQRDRLLALAAKTTYYLNTRTTTASVNNIQNRGDVSATIITAVCAYL